MASPEAMERCLIEFMDTLGDYIDRRIEYAAGDPEWRSSREVALASDKLEAAFKACLEGAAS